MGVPCPQSLRDPLARSPGTALEEGWNLPSTS
jgi:hypothetical protein